MTMVEKLLWLARDIAARGTRSNVLKRRAVSTAYYAVFHALARLCTSELLGRDKAINETVEHERVYRALDHGSLKSAFLSGPLRSNQKLNDIGARVVRLQSERIKSDYLPAQHLYSPAKCEDLMALAESTLFLLSELSADERRVLAVHLIFKNRPQ